MIKKSKAITTIQVAIIAAIIIVAVAGGEAWYFLGRPTPAVKVEQKLVIGTTDPVDSLDPHKTVSWFSALVVTQIFDSLLKVNPKTLEIEPGLAESYTVSSDGLILTFNLRHGVKFHDGSNLTAGTIKYSFERLHNYTLSGQDPMGFLFDHFASVEALDDYTVRITLAYAFVPTIDCIANMWAVIVSPTSVQKYGDAFGDTAVIGTGPFKFVEWVKGDRIVLEANKDYWGGTPTLDKLVIRFFGEWSTLKLALQNNEVDMAYTYGYMPTDIPVLEADSDIIVKKSGGTVMRMITVGCKGFPMNNSLLRQAIAYALDYNQILKVGFQNTADRALSTVHSWNEYYVPTFSKYVHNPDLAKQLMAQAGYSNGFSIDLYYTPAHYGPMEPEVALTIKSNLEEVGIQCNTVGLEWGVFKETRMGLVGGLCLSSWSLDYPDPDNMLDPQMNPVGYYGAVQVDNLSYAAHANALLYEGRSTYNVTRRMEIYKELQEIMAEELPCIPFAEACRYVFYQRTILGYEMSAVYQIEDFENVVKAVIP